MPDQLTVTFQYSPVEHAEALSEAVAGRKFRRRMRLLGILIGSAGPLAAGLRVLDRAPFVGLLPSDWAVVALGAFWVWGGPVLLTAMEGRQLRRQASQDSRDVESLAFGPAGFSPSLKWPEPMPWSFVDRVIETQRFLLIYHGYSKDPFYIPKHALSPSDMERLFALLSENLKSGPTQLQLLSPEQPG